MADKDDIKEGKDFGVGIPQENKAFYVKGSGALDWGMQNRLARIFNPASGRTVMLAFDHGYFQGPTTGLERIDLSIVPLIPYADVLMCTRGALRSVIPPSATNAVVLRCSGGQSILTELSREAVAVDIEDAIRLNAAAITTQIYIGAEYEHQSIKNLIQLIDTGNRVGIPTMAVTGVGAEMKRDARYFGLATRIAAELGAHYVKSYFVEEGFERVCAGCPVPIVIAGGKKLPELEALTMAYKAIDQGAAGVDMGRNIFQSDDPIAMIQAVGAVVHKKESPQKAFQLYQQLKVRNVPDRSRVARTS
ncbi:MAG: 3-hydroxy-5-phosphonooxypentane-2,4-dione thiolase [Burkholderiales bacterium]